MYGSSKNTCSHRLAMLLLAITLSISPVGCSSYRARRVDLIFDSPAVVALGRHVGPAQFGRSDWPVARAAGYVTPCESIYYHEYFSDEHRLIGRGDPELRFRRRFEASRVGAVTR